jgi:catechol 2,3-dioxygenase-like lactoylglutathione lyase family enzyme
MALAPAASGARSTRADIAGQVQSGAFALPRVAAIGFSVSDLERASAALEELDFVPGPIWVDEGPSFEALVGLPSARARSRQLRLGREVVVLSEYQTPKGRAIPDDSSSNDGWFQHLALVVSDMDVAFARVSRSFSSDARAPFAPISPAPQTLPLTNPAAGGIRASYFKDFDGHALELIWYPVGKGRPTWHGERTGLFLGIDHTAIATTDSDSSLWIYRDALGLRVAGTSLNFGREQSLLSGVPGARVRITGLSSATGAAPGVEFLQYLAPGAGRVLPNDTLASDLWHWEISLEVTDVAAAANAITAHGGRRISRQVAELPTTGNALRRELLVLDRDGHALRLTEGR